MKVVAEVDVELGLTRVVWIGAAQEIGQAIDPRSVEGQIEGGIAQGLGLALMEEIQTRDGLITNASFTDYLIPTTLDMPPVETVLIEDPEPNAAVRREGRRRAADGRLDRRGRRGAPRRDRPRAAARARSPGRDRRPRPHLTPSSGAVAAGGSCRTTTATAATTIAAPIRIRTVRCSLRNSTPSRIATIGFT